MSNPGERAANPIAESIAPGLGRIVIAFNSLEETVDAILLRLLSSGPDEGERAWIVVSEMNYGAKVNVLEKLYNYDLRGRESGEETREKISLLVKTLWEAGNRRNAILHANWSDIDEAYQVKIKTKVYRDGAQSHFRFIGPDEIENDKLFIEEAEADLRRFDEGFISDRKAR